MLHILWHILIGFLVGLLARAVYPGAQNLGFILTTALGIAGGFVGGLIARLFSRPDPNSPVHPVGLLMSIVGAVLVLFLYTRFAPVS